MLLLDITVVNTALPDIQEDLDASFTDLQWVIDAYALALAALVLTAGSLADRLGRRRVFAAGLAVFSVASLLCGLATEPTFLNLARGLQGVGGAIMFAVSLALIAQEFRGRELGTATGIYGATIGGAVAIGPLVGGALAEWLGWEAIFYLNVPIGIGAAGSGIGGAGSDGGVASNGSSGGSSRGEHSAPSSESCTRSSTTTRRRSVPNEAPEFVRNVLGEIIGAIILGIIAGYLGRLLLPHQNFRRGAHHAHLQAPGLHHRGRGEWRLAGLVHEIGGQELQLSGSGLRLPAGLRRDRHDDCHQD